MHIKKFLVIAFAMVAFLFLYSETGSAQSCRWREGGSYRTAGYGYAPGYSYGSAEYGYAPRSAYSYRRHRRFPRRRGATFVAGFGPFVSYSYRPVRRYYYTNY
ncbi:MAG: hypothetical protein ACJ72Z_06285 [Pyrinomonadaceae bacterium]